MVDALFIVNKFGELFLEKIWRSSVTRTVCDHFLEAQAKADDPVNVPLVITTGSHYLLHVCRDSVFLVAACGGETPPLLVVEFLHRVVDTLVDYFGRFTESAIREQCVVVYELLDEMLDNGFPLATEPNVLHELIRPPNVLRAISNSVTGGSNVSATLPSGQLSSVPWRRSDVRYSSNEAFFDIIEQVDAIIDKSGATVMAAIRGRVASCVKLSGVPDLTLSFGNTALFDDVSFHPCVRLRRWQSERVVSFVPPDGNFTLMTYHVSSRSPVPLPLCVRHSVSVGGSARHTASSATAAAPAPSTGHLDLTVSPSHTMGRGLDDLVLYMQMPKQVVNCVLTASEGRYTFEPGTRKLVWTVGRLEPGRAPTLRGHISLQTAAGPYTAVTPAITVQFSMKQLALSGNRVVRLDVYGEKYRPFKGVKYITEAGRYQIRT